MNFVEPIRERVQLTQIKNQPRGQRLDVEHLQRLVFRPASFNTHEWLETEHFKECQGKKQLNWPS